MATRVKLETSDKQHFEVDVKVANMSETVKTMIETLGLEERGKGDELEIIPLPNVDGATLRKVLEWANRHKDDNPPVSEVDYKEKKNDLIPIWDADFLKAEHDSWALVQLVLAANYLDIRGLLEMSCTTVANFMIKGRTAEEIRQKFNITNDFTPDQEKQILAENAWCEDK